MASGRTISANFLTERDKSVVQLCKQISEATIAAIPDEQEKRKFKDMYGKIANSRDAGAGMGGGKLQRDALCTRGIQGKAPFSNRNLRWHPLVAAERAIKFGREIERIEIEGEPTDNAQTLIFVVRNDAGEELKYPSDRVFELPRRFYVLPKHWLPHIDRLRLWNDTLWTQNSCLITAYEACEWYDAAESYAVLSISIAVNFFGVDFARIYEEVTEILGNQQIDAAINLPDIEFPNNADNIISCPLCKVAPSENAARFPVREREVRWKPSWGGNKRGEGEDGSTQIMHVQPLTEIEIRHNARNVRFGHRWCNVAMTDHSIEETVDFMEYIVRAHNRI